MDRTMLRRAAAGISVLGMTMVGMSALAPVASATSTPASYSGFTASGSNTFTQATKDTDNCHGIIVTPGSDPATKTLGIDPAPSFTPGTVVPFIVSDNAHDNSGTNNYTLHDCIASYPAGTFTASDFQDGKINGTGVPAPGSESKFKKYTSVVDQALLTGIQDNTAPVTYTWTVPQDMPVGMFVCNFVKDTGNNHGDHGNRKASACFQVPPPPGELTVNKIVTGDNGPTGNWSFVAHVVCTKAETDDLVFDLTLTKAHPSASHEVAAGSSCTVTEPDSQDALSVTISPDQPVTVPEAGAAVTITNAYSPAPGGLMVTKSVTGGTAAPSTWSFVAHVVCTNDPNSPYDLTLTNLVPSAEQFPIPAGSTCTVTEPSHSGVQTVTITPNNGVVTIPSDDDATVTITNAYSTVIPTCVVNCSPVIPTPSVTVVKTNDAGGNPFAKTNTAKNAGDSVDFLAVITNTSSESETITSITDVWGANSAPECANLINTVLASGASVSCGFTISGYAPAAGSSLTDTVTVLVKDSNNQTASASDTSTVTTPAPAVLPEVVTTVAPTTTTTVAPTTTTLPTAVLPLTGTRTLPFTGTNVRLLLLAGLGLILLGLGLLAGSWRMPEQADR